MSHIRQTVDSVTRGVVGLKLNINISEQGKEAEGSEGVEKYIRHVLFSLFNSKKNCQSNIEPDESHSAGVGPRQPATSRHDDDSGDDEGWAEHVTYNSNSECWYGTM